MRLRTNRRRGMILLVVLVMLTLFAIAGLTFVLYAEAAAESARFNKDAESFAVSNAPDMDPNTSLDLFLGQLIYGTTNDLPGSASALRGHSLAETMYGSYDSLGNAPYVPSDVPYNGTGRLHFTHPPTDPVVFQGQDEYSLVNYTYFQSDLAVHDPSRYGTRSDPRQPYSANDLYTGGQNPPYTYPDANSMFLASVQLVNVNGQMVPEVVMPSYFGRQAVDWNSPQGKYTTLRPRPIDMNGTANAVANGFPYPPAPTPQNPNPLNCDVKNISGLPGGPDSIWMDVGAPELYTASGLRYKMLVAPLVLDLDNKINLNVVGNVLASAQANRHAGNQGWGQWEVNMSRVLNVEATGNPASTPIEWQNVFLGRGSVTGRYGAGQLPANTFALSGPVPHVYAQADLNGVNDPGQPGAFTSTMAWSLPAGASCFPTFPPTGYGNGGTLETTNNGQLPPAGTDIHPMFFNPLFQAANGPNRLLPIFSHASLMYAGPSASPNSDLVQLCPNNFNAVDPNTLKRIYETTLLSMELDRSGASPYLSDSAGYAISYNPVNGQYAYAGTPQAFPNPAGHVSTNGPAPGAEFDPRTWRSVLPAVLSRMDLDRQLATYASTGGTQPPDRQQFATDIFTRLLYVTGMYGVYNNGNPSTATPQQYATLRFLAQLSANVVDYIDTDDVMTVFQWAATPQAPDNGYVLGTELPKLVVNEVYLQYNNDPNDPFPKNAMMVKTASKPYQMNVWTELVNPLPSDTNAQGNPSDLNGSNQAVLQNANGTPLYRLVLTQPNQGLRNADNIVGDPDGPAPGSAPYATQPYAPTGQYTTGAANKVLTVVNSWGNGMQVVTPMGANYGNGASATAGFVVVGPQVATDQGLPAATFQSPSMTYTVPLTDATANTPVAPTVLLQRLANPNLPWSNTVGAGYNPYVTVDYADLNPLAQGGPPPVNPAVNDARTYSLSGQIAGAPMQPYTGFSSFGRNEPYASVCLNNVHNQWQPQKPNPANKNGPQTSFFQQNVNANTPGPNNATQPGFTPPPNYPSFHWLTHMDRPLVSPAELAHVSAFKPQELTQQFIDVNGNLYGQYAPWLNQQSNLYRLLEFVKVKNPTPGFVNGGRIPGRVNINTIDPNATEVFEALCDAEPGNNFYVAGNPDQNVVQVFQTLMKQRTPNGVPATGDQPFWGMAQGPSPNPANDAMGTTPRGIIQTLLAPSANPAVAGQAAVVPNALASGHPYQQLELLNKLYNNTTTRSNVFAVWLTVGFFQITDDTTQPMKLGPEINAAQGKAIRHHMFAIVDRTQITTFTTKTSAAIGPGNNVGINVPASVTDPRTTLTWNIQAGTTLVYDPGAYHTNPVAGPNPDPNQSNEETVVVQPGGTATFLYPHPAGTPVISRGHPGPWQPKYDPSQDGQVVPYYVIID